MPAQAPHRYETFFRDFGLFLIRRIIGVVLVVHGSQKLFGGIEGFAGYLDTLGVPAPLLNAWVAASVEFFGGIAIAAGVLTRLVAVPVAFTMGVAFFVGHGGVFDMRQGGGEYALTLGVISVALVFTGAGQLTVTRLVRHTLRKRTKRSAADAA